MGADTKANTREASWFERQAAYSSDCSVMLPLRPSARAAPPWGPRWLYERLRAWERRWGAECQWALTRKQTLWGGSALEVGDLRLLEDGSERGCALGSNAVVSETASEGQDGKQ